MSELLELPAAAAIDRILSGELSSAEYFAAWAEAAADDELNAYLWTQTPRSEERAARSDGADGALPGIPVAVKDIFCTEGVETTAGSRILEGYRPPYTATAVRRLTGAGARVLGKTNTDGFPIGGSHPNSGFRP